MDGIGSYEVVLTQMSVADKYPLPIRTSFKCDIMDGRSCCIIVYQVTKNYMPTLHIINN